MKKILLLVLTLVCIIGLVACQKQEDFKIGITVPAGSMTDFVFSDENIIPKGDKITITLCDGQKDTAILLAPVNENLTAGYVATYIMPNVPVEFDTSEGEPLKIGVNAQNPTEEDIFIYLEVKDVDISIK